MAKLRRALAEFVPGPIVRKELPGGASLFWFSCRPSDGLHEFEDGYVIGRLSFEDSSGPALRRHAGPLPNLSHPLLPSAVIRHAGEDVSVEPRGIASVYAYGSTVSDLQLVIADAEALRPSPEGLTLLAAVGYFPGTFTFFEGVHRIDLLGSYSLRTGLSHPYGTFQPKKADDALLIKRLIELVPSTASHSLGMSGGYDSRFLLGILLAAGARPTLMHLKGTEEELVRRIGSSLELRTVVTGGEDPLPARVYTILTDGQIYYKGGLYNRLRSVVKREDLYHMGLFADSLVKNAFKSAWKIPGPRRKLVDRLIDHALLSGSPPILEGLQHRPTRTETRETISKNLHPWRGFLSGLSRKAAANWFYYYNRGLRWSPATTADLQFYTQVVFLLSDLEALEHGILSGAWANFRKDRLRDLNRLLLPDLDVGYSDGLEAARRPGPGNVVARLKAEYASRLLMLWRMRKNRAKRSQSFAKRENAQFGDLPRMTDYLAAPAPVLLRDPRASLGLRRSVITLAHVLNYLEEPHPRPPDQPGSELPASNSSVRQ